MTLDDHLYSMREVGRMFGNKDPRTVERDALRLGIRMWNTTTATFIDADGLETLRMHYQPSGDLKSAVA